jgi:quercetin dioxygenase-like cupin family protein
VPRSSFSPRAAAPAHEHAASPSKPQTTFEVDPAIRFEREHRCDAKHCRLDHGLPEAGFATTPHEALPSKVSLWVEQLAARSVVEFPANGSLQFVVFVLAGDLEFAMRAPEQKGRLGRFDALAVPGADFQLECTGDACQVFVAAIAVQNSLRDALAGASSTVPKPSSIAKGSLADARECPLAGGAGTASVVLEGGHGDASFTLSVLGANANQTIPIHVHEESWANLLVLSGSADGFLRGRPYQFQAGQLLQAPPGVRHGFSVRGREPWVAVAIHAPAEREPCFMKSRALP